VHGTLGEMSNSSDKLCNDSDKLCNDSDNSTQPLQIISTLINTKEKQKFPRQDLMIFYGHDITYRRVNVHI